MHNPDDVGLVLGPQKCRGQFLSPGRRQNSFPSLTLKLRRKPALLLTSTTNPRCRITITGTACSAQILTNIRTLYKTQFQIHLLYPLLVFMIIRHCHQCTLSRLPYCLHRVKALTAVSILSLTIYTTVSRHNSHPSMVARTTSHPRPQYFNPNGYHSPSPNPPPYTEYATELNCPQSLRHQGSGSSYWTAIGGDSSRYLEGQSNRWVNTSYVFDR